MDGSVVNVIDRYTSCSPGRVPFWSGTEAEQQPETQSNMQSSAFHGESKDNTADHQHGGILIIVERDGKHFVKFNTPLRHV